MLVIVNVDGVWGPCDAAEERGGGGGGLQVCLGACVDVQRHEKEPELTKTDQSKVLHSD